MLVVGAFFGLVTGWVIGMAWATYLWKRRLTRALIRRIELRTKNGRPPTQPLNALLDDFGAPTCEGMGDPEFWSRT